MYKLWSYVPLFALTDEDCMPLSCDKKCETEQKYKRLSCINILLGEYRICFIIFLFCKKKIKFEFFHSVKMSEMEQFILTNEHSEKLKKEYREHLENLTQEDVQIEKEALLRKLNDEQLRVNKCLTKTNIYTSIVLVYIPLFAKSIKCESIRNISTFKIIIWVVILYAIINLIAWIINTINTRAYLVSSFSDLKRSDEKQKEINCQIYYDWQQTKRKADAFVSLVSCTQDCLVALIIFSCLWFIF